MTFKGLLNGAQLEGRSRRSPLLPVLLCLRLMGRLPLTAHPDGTLSFKLYSWPMVYCFLFTTAKLLIAVYIVHKRVNLPQLWSSFDTIVGSIMSTLLLVTVVHPVLFTWGEAPGISTAINRWTSVQASFEKTTKRQISSFILDHPWRWASFITLLSAAEYTAILNKDYDGLEHTMFALILFYLNYVICFWVVATTMVSTASSHLKESLLEAIACNPPLEVIRNHRFLWQELQSFTYGLSDAVGGSILAWETITMTGFALGLYRSAMFALEGQLVPLHVLVYPLQAGAQMLLLHNLSSSANHKIRYEFLVGIFSSKLNKLSPAHTVELDLFVYAVEYPGNRFLLRGLLNFTRMSILNLIETTLTYLVILVQFKIKP